jgi:hypothetical protein
MRLSLWKTAPSEPRELLPEVVEIKTLWLAVFVVRNHKIGNGLRLRSRAFGLALLTLGFALGLFLTFFLARPLFLSLSKSCTRASCHTL